MDQHQPCFCDACLSAYYNQPCAGYPGSHPSFWKTVIESPQWQVWRKDNQSWDFGECEELGIISVKHFQDFMKFTIEKVLEEEKDWKKTLLEKKKIDDLPRCLSSVEKERGRSRGYQEAMDEALKIIKS